MRHHFADKGPKAMVFSVVMYGCESWTVKKAERQRIDAFEAEHQRIDAFELWYWRRLLRVLWTARRSNQEINQSRIFTGRTDAEAEATILWPPNAMNLPAGKDLDAGKDWRQKEKGMTEDEMVVWHHQQKGTTEDEMVGWHHWLDEHEFEQGLGVGHWQGSLVCCSPWGHKESDTTEWLNWTDTFACIHIYLFSWSSTLFLFGFF